MRDSDAELERPFAPDGSGPAPATATAAAPPPVARKATLVSIQYLRAFAALAVVAQHTGHTRGMGQVGVDIFFVISGFIMWMVTQRESTPGDFLLHRAIRIWPLYILATLVMLTQAPWAGWQLARSLLFIPYLNASGKAWPLLLQGWTLNYEMFFYGLFALSLCVPRRPRLAVLAVLMVTLVGVGLLLRQPGPIAATYTSPMLLEFLAGVAISALAGAGRLPGPRTGVALVALGLAALAASAVVHTEEAWRALVWGVPSAAIVAGMLSLDRAGKVPVLPPLRFLGDASYSIYLFHTFVLDSIVTRLSLPPIVIVPLVLAAVCVVCSLIYLVVERPLTRALQKVALRRARPTLPPAFGSSPA